MKTACLALALALPALAAAEEVIPIGALLKARKEHNGRNLCVAGKTSTLFQKFSRKGNHYWSVWVDDGTGRIKVFGYGYPSFKEGEEIEGCGQYLVEKWVSGRVFHDELTTKVVLTGASMRAGRVLVSTAGVVALDPPPETPAEKPKEKPRPKR